jgi:hypothetical protein
MKRRPKVTGSAASDEGGQYADRTHKDLAKSGNDSPDLADPAALVSPDTSQDDPEDTARLPAVTRTPEGVTVVEQHLGHAVGQWIFQVRCDCGRRWFDLKAVDNVQCPRCGLWVHVEVDPRGGGA